MKRKVNTRKKGLSRRQFLGTVGKGAAIGALAPITFKGIPSIFAAAGTEQVKKRRLGKTELMISEIGIGAHTFSSWIKDCSDKQAVEILAANKTTDTRIDRVLIIFSLPKEQTSPDSGTRFASMLLQGVYRCQPS